MSGSFFSETLCIGITNDRLLVRCGVFVQRFIQTSLLRSLPVKFINLWDTYTGWSKKADTRETVWVSAFLDHPVVKLGRRNSDFCFLSKRGVTIGGCGLHYLTPEITLNTMQWMSHRRCRTACRIRSNSFVVDVALTGLSTCHRRANS